MGWNATLLRVVELVMGWNVTLLRVVKLETGWKGNPICHTYIDNVPIQLYLKPVQLTKILYSHDHCKKLTVFLYGPDCSLTIFLYGFSP